MDIRIIFSIVEDSIFYATIIIALLYSCLIIFLRRFHQRNNVFIVNLCINTICTCVFFVIYFKAVYYDISPELCVFFHYAFNVVSMQVAFAFVAFSIHRFCTILYHTKAWLKTKLCIVICISSQWLGQFIISLPFVFARYDVSILLIYHRSQGNVIDFFLN